jgi:hypothetical protein
MKGWKTIAFNIGMLALASPEVLALIPPKAALYVSVFGNLILRAVTTTPMAGMSKNTE